MSWQTLALRLQHYAGCDGLDRPQTSIIALRRRPRNLATGAEPCVAATLVEIIEHVDWHSLTELWSPLEHELLKGLGKVTPVRESAADRVADELNTAQALKLAPERGVSIVLNGVPEIAGTTKAVRLLVDVAVRCVPLKRW